MARNGGRTINRYPRSYGEAVAMKATINGNTHLRKEEGEVSVVLHSTAVVTFYADGRIRFSSGGWRTAVTLDRLAECMPIGWRMHGSPAYWGWRQSGPQNGGQPWMIETPSGTYDFEDGMVLDVTEEEQ